MSYCLHETPGKDALNASPVTSSTPDRPAAVALYYASNQNPNNPLNPNGNFDLAAEEAANELSPLLSEMGRIPETSVLRNASRRSELEQAIPRLTLNMDVEGADPRGEMKDRSSSFKNLNALEIAVIANAKRFLSQHIVQKIITSLWHGEIVFWDQVSAYATKKPRYHNPRTADPYSRLRVPKYLKAWEMFFFIVFLVLYYSVVLERSPTRIPAVEVIFYFWLASFFWDEFQEWVDAGVFYMADIWNAFDMAMITLGVIFAVLREAPILEISCE